MKRHNQHHPDSSNGFAAAATSTTAHTGVATKSGREAREYSAIIWIIAAWVIGTLVSELNVIG